MTIGAAVFITTGMDTATPQTNETAPPPPTDAELAEVEGLDLGPETVKTDEGMRAAFESRLRALYLAPAMAREVRFLRKVSAAWRELALAHGQETGARAWGRKDEQETAFARVASAQEALRVLGVDPDGDQ